MDYVRDFNRILVIRVLLFLDLVKAIGYVVGVPECFHASRTLRVISPMKRGWNAITRVLHQIILKPKGCWVMDFIS